jgi:AraC-like DNA-binding protein
MAEISPHEPVALRRAGLPASILQGPSRIARNRSDALWQAATTQTDPALPLRVAERVGPRTYGHFTYLLAATPTVGESLRALCRHYPTLLGNTTAHRLDATKSRVRLSIDPLGDRPACVDLFSVAVVASFVRRHAHVSPTRVFVAGTLDGCERSRAQTTFGCPVDTTARHLGLEYATEALGATLHGADAQLRDLLEEHARWRVAAATSARAQVEAEIEERGATPGLRAVEIASALGLSVRTLRRRLAAESTSFQEVLDERLRHAALEQLQHCSVDEAARTLGYADGSALRRAHRRWFGTSPRGVSSPASQAR